MSEQINDGVRGAELPGGTRSAGGGAPKSGVDAGREERSVKIAAFAMLLLLCVEFIAGMLANLFIEVPRSHPGAEATEYFAGLVQAVIWVVGARHLGILVFHASLGLLLAAGSLAVILLAIRTGRRSWIVTAILGWFGVFAAGFHGVSFLDYGHDFSSFIMSTAFLLALVSYSVGVYLS